MVSRGHCFRILSLFDFFGALCSGQEAPRRAVHVVVIPRARTVLMFKLVKSVLHCCSKVRVKPAVLLCMRAQYHRAFSSLGTEVCKLPSGFAGAAPSRFGYRRQQPSGMGKVRGVKGLCRVSVRSRALTRLRDIPSHPVLSC